MMARKPELRKHMVQLQSGLGMPGGPRKPTRCPRYVSLARQQGDTLYRIHGTNEPWTIGTNVSSGCIRLTNEDVADLYNRTRVGTKVIVASAALQLLLLTHLFPGRHYPSVAGRSYRRKALSLDDAPTLLAIAE